MRFFRRGRRLVRMILCLATLAVVASGCTGGSLVSVRDVALDLARDLRVRNEVFFRADSICSAIIVTHPMIRDSVGEEIPFLFEKCWPINEDEGPAVVPDSTPIGSLAR